MRYFKAFSFQRSLQGALIVRPLPYFPTSMLLKAILHLRHNWKYTPLYSKYLSVWGGYYNHLHYFSIPNENRDPVDKNLRDLPIK